MSAVTVPYLGKPLAMRALPSPNDPITAAPTYGDSVKRLISGGIAVIRGGLSPKIAYSLPYRFLDSASASLLLGFYHRLYGLGPFVFVDPSVRNVLRLDVSTMGLRPQASAGWVKSTGTLATSATGGPAGFDSGVLTWTALAASATLQPGSVANTADTTLAPVYVPSEPVSVSLWVKASAASSGHSLQLTGYDANGAVLVTSVAAPLSLTTSWTWFTASIPAGAAAFSAAAFVLPRIVLGASVPTSVSIAAAQIEYSTVATVFEPGHGSPRVLPSAPPGRDVQQTADFATDHTFVLAEV